MKRALCLLSGTAVAATLVLAGPAPAQAGPVVALCTADSSRGGVPVDFVLDACAGLHTVTVRNNLDEPVLVAAGGDVGPPERPHQRVSSTGPILRALTGQGLVLMPGDIVWWPVGAGAADIAVSPMRPAVQAIAEKIETFLPNLGMDEVDQDDYLAFAVVARDTAAAVRTRAACIEGKNFLQVAACDVTASAEVARVAIAQLPRRTALQVLSVTQDPQQWDDWAAVPPGVLAGVEPHQLHLAQAPKPLPPPPVPVPAPAAAAPVSRAPAVPAPAAAHVPSSLEQLIQQILAWKQAHEGDRDDDGGNGRGRGHGNGD